MNENMPFQDFRNFRITSGTGNYNYQDCKTVNYKSDMAVHDKILQLLRYIYYQNFKTMPFKCNVTPRPKDTAAVSGVSNASVIHIVHTGHDLRSL